MENAEQIPGTVHLVDLEGTILAKHSSSGQRDIVLVPAPSDDPDDPLNWSPKRKLLSTTCMCVYTLMIGIASVAIYSVLEPIAKDTGLTLNDLNAGTGYMFLLFGWGCLVWQPLALQYGKRPVYLLSILATMAIMIWVPYTTSNGQWIASKVLQGFFGAPIESLCEISVTDIYFTHERGTYMALYALFLAGSNFLAPILAGFINDGQGWKWVLYWCSIFCAIGFVFLFFCMEETNYHRGSRPMDTADVESGVKMSPESSVDPAGEKKAAMDLSVGSVENGYSKKYQQKTYWHKLKLFESTAWQRPNRLGGMMLRPLIFLTFPVICYAGFSYGSNLVWFNVLNATASLILSGSPYRFSSSMVGLAYLSPLIGVIFGFIYTGRLGDWLVIKMARRNRGIMESEHRLWLFSVSLLCIPGALLLWGVGAAKGIHWFGLVFAMGVIAFTNTLGIQISVSYCIDSYRELSGEAMVTVIIVRNTMSFAIGYGSVHMSFNISDSL
jgi:MFS family permease